MSGKPQTIEIFLPQGDPRGIRIAEITTRIVQVIEVPRSLLEAFLSMERAKQDTLYFLFGGSDDDEMQVYIGQTSDLDSRLRDHNQKKDFWERAVFVVSRTHRMTSTHTMYLEWLSIQQARQARRYSDENRNSGSRPHTRAPLQAECDEIFETAKTLLATLGYPVFTPVVLPESSDENQILICNASGTDGRGRYTPEGFVVLEGSRGSSEDKPSIIGKSGERSREKLREAGDIREEGAEIVFTRDKLFGSPTAAAVALLGTSENGWTVWKTAGGRTLHEIKRGDPSEDPDRVNFPDERGQR